MLKKVTLSLLAFMLVCVSAALAQTKTVSGVVTSADDDSPITGAFVLVTGTQLGSTTDADGSFEIKNVPSNASSITVSFLGYRTKEVKLTGAKLDILLESDTEALEGVVVTAQGLTRKEKSIGYSTVQLDAEKLTMSRQTDLGQSLAGKVSGARFFSSSGATFDSGSIVLRGTQSYTSMAGSEPIYVVDGTIASKNSVNMDDVESVNILKGPAATALYGSQGGNGAVVITTKGAKAGESHIEFSHTIAAESLYNHYKLQKEYGGGSYGNYGEQLGNREAYANEDTMSAAWLFGKYEGQNADGSYIMDYYSDESWGPRFDANTLVANAYYYDPSSPYYMKADPWISRLDLGDLYQTGWTNTTNIAFSKASAGHSTRVSFTNTDRSGISYNSRAVRRYLTVKDQFKPTKWLTFTLDYKFTYRQNHNAAGEGYGSSTNPLFDFVQWGHTNVDISRYKDYATPSGAWRTWNPVSAEDPTAMFHDNPYAVMYTNNRYSTEIWNVITGDTEFKLPFNLKAGFRFMGNIKSSNSETKRAAGSINYTSYYGETQYHTRDLTFQGRLTWDKTFIQDRLGVNAAAFIEERQYDYGTLSANTTDGLTIDGYYNLNATSGYVSASNSKTQYKTRSVYGNATISFDDTYFLDLSLRNDWDSRLPLINNSFLYGGASASVMLSSFVKAPWLNFWKLRASVAQVGSTLGAYSTSYVYGAGTKYNSVATLSQSSTQLNQAIKPTISQSYEVGTEFKLFKNRLHGDFNLYQRDSKNQILNVDVAPQTGYSTRQLNAGLIRNKGIEITIGGTPVQTRDFSWDVDFNWSKNINTLEYLNDDMTEYQLGWNRLYYAWGMDSIVGKPVGEMYTAARWARNDEGKLILKKTTSGSWGGGYQPTYELNVNKYVGNFQPKFNGGFSTGFRYKNLYASASFDYSVGGKLVSWSNMWGSGSGILASSSKLNNNGVNEREPIAKGGGVHVVGVDADGNEVDCYMNAYNYYHYQAYYDNDNWVYDRSYLKMREASITYTLPRELLKKMNIGLHSASISVVATNPWLIYSAIPNIDPSESSSNYIEGGQAPSTRSFGATLKLMF